VKTEVQVAALGAAVLLALQLVVSHWFYLYVVWFTPFVLVALFALYRDGYPAQSTPGGASTEDPRPVPALA
jgi:hypothetical protein